MLSDISIQLAKKDAKKVETNFTIAVTSPSVTCYFSSVPSTAIYPQVLAVLAQTDWAHPTLHKLSSGSATYNANMYRTNPFLRTLTAVQKSTNPDATNPIICDLPYMLPAPLINKAIERLEQMLATTGDPLIAAKMAAVERVIR